MKTLEQVIGHNTTVAVLEKAWHSIEWKPAKATLRGVLVEGVLHEWDASKPVDIMIGASASFGCASRQVLPRELMPYDIDAGFVYGEWVFLRYQSSKYKKRGKWMLPVLDDPLFAQDCTADGESHRYAHLYEGAPCHP